jgi:hypothetical protein
MQAALVDVIVKEREKKPGPWIGYQGKPEAWAPHIMGNYEPRTVWNVIAHWSEIALLPPLAALFAAWLTKRRKPKN